MIILKGNKVILQEANDGDLAELFYWKFEEKEQAAKKWNGPYIKEKRVSKEAYRQSWKQDIIEGIPSSLVIKTGEKVIGYVGSYWVDKHTNWLETGIVIYDSNYWNGGYGSEAYNLWIDYLFASTAIHRLGMSTWSGNSRMIRVAEKLGMKEEARVREARVVNGEYFDAIKMGILRREWEGLK